MKTAINPSLTLHKSFLTIASPGTALSQKALENEEEHIVTTILAERPTPAATGSLTGIALLYAVAEDVSKHDFKNLGGIDRIEYRPAGEAATLPSIGTVFEVMDESLRAHGRNTDGTAGDIIEKLLGFPKNTTENDEAIHEIGCNCHGEFISPKLASQRILNYERKLTGPVA
jgi:hypothetical protein